MSKYIVSPMHGGGKHSLCLGHTLARGEKRSDLRLAQAGLWVNHMLKPWRPREAYALFRSLRANVYSSSA